MLPCEKDVLYCYSKQTFNFFGIICNVFQLQALVLSHVIKLFSTLKKLYGKQEHDNFKSCIHVLMWMNS